MFDEKFTKECFQKLIDKAEEGNDCEAIENLGVIYYLLQDYEKAFFWLNKAMENYSWDMKIYYYLFEMYRDGKGVEKNKEEELKCLKLAAMYGSKGAIEELCERL